MGLDVSHDCWHGAYSAFARWREKLAEVAGFPPLHLMQGFWGFGPDVSEIVRDAVQVKYGDTKYYDRLVEGLPIKWDIFAADPLTVILYHSDCDGEIEVKDLIPLANRLEALIPLLPDGTEFPTNPLGQRGHIGNWRAKTQEFVDGLKYAAEKNEPVTFG